MKARGLSRLTVVRSTIFSAWLIPTILKKVFAKSILGDVIFISTPRAVKSLLVDFALARCDAVWVVEHITSVSMEIKI